MAEFDIIKYLEGLTAFVFDKAVLNRIAMERDLSSVGSYKDLTQEQKDLALADLLFVVYTSPNYTASFTNQHGAYTQTIGSQRYDTKKDVYNVMVRLYQKWNDDKLDFLPLEANDTVWVNEYD